MRFKTNTMDEKAAHGVWCVQCCRVVWSVSVCQCVFPQCGHPCCLPPFRLSLKSAIEQIFAANASSLSFEELYRFAYNLVLHKHGQMLYDGVKATITEKLRAVANVGAVWLAESARI